MDPSNEMEIKVNSRIQHMAGPTNPLSSKRVQVLKPKKFTEEPLSLTCEWKDCDFTTANMEAFSAHVFQHTPDVALVPEDEENEEASFIKYTVYLKCNWTDCPYMIPQIDDLKRHLYLHAYHTRLKCIGTNTIVREGLNQCKADSSNRNIIPDLSENLICAWDNCSEKFINIQYYYDHIRHHCGDNPRGKNIPGGIRCLWSGCGNTFCNISKLRDHMRTHTQEKLLACPTCGAMFSNRTRLFDHCRRQVPLEEQSYACTVCLRSFSTGRLLRDHIRSHINTYKCSMCEMSCSTPSALQSHIKYRHRKEKPFPCPHCTYAAKTHNDITRHIRLHDTAKPIYKCTEEGCDYEAKTLASFNNHYAKEHGESKDDPLRYLCHMCDKRTLRGYYLTRHLTSVHKLQWPSGHSRFRYKLHDDGYYRLLTERYESIEENGEDEGEEDEEEEEAADEEDEEEEVVDHEVESVKQEFRANGQKRIKLMKNEEDSP